MYACDISVHLYIRLLISATHKYTYMNAHIYVYIND